MASSDNAMDDRGVAESAQGPGLRFGPGSRTRLTGAAISGLQATAACTASHPGP